MSKLPAVPNIPFPPRPQESQSKISSMVAIRTFAQVVDISEKKTTSVSVLQI